MGCELPTENISYERNPVLFGYIDAGLNRIEPIYLSWSNTFSTSHLDQNNYIENANISISTSGNNPEYENIEFTHIDSGEYHAIYPDNLQITPGSQWNINITFTDQGKDYILNSSTVIPENIIFIQNDYSKKKIIVKKVSSKRGSYEKAITLYSILEEEKSEVKEYFEKRLGNKRPTKQERRDLISMKNSSNFISNI